MFGRPDRKKYGAKPFWAWNGKLDKDELVRQTEVMKEMGFGGYFMHSRTGLATEYLSDEWFDDINACADAAEKEDMEAWLYDEDRWPSGSAGGIATKEIKYRMQYIRCNIVIKDSFEWSDDIICAFSADVDGINFTDCVKIEKHTDIASLPARNVIYFTQEYMIPSSTYNESAYLDTLSAEATEHFIETTHDLYAKKCGKLMGKSIQKSTSVEGFPRKFLISFLQTVDALGKLHLFTVVILMRHVQHVQKFTFTGTFHNVVHTAHGITAVNKNKLLYLSLQHCLDHRFSEATEISRGDLVRKLKILRHFLKNRTFLAKALKQLQRCIFTDVMYHDRFSSLPSDSISRYA